MHRTPSRAGRDQSGFTLVELMVAVTVSLFLLGGLFASLQSTRHAFRNQSALAELQDNQRLAMALISGVVESAGYYPNPKVNDANTVMPAVGTTWAAGQSILGTYSAAVPGDPISVRYGAGQNDNVFNCAGQQNTAVAGFDTFLNRFHVDNATQTLMCQYTTAAGTQDVVLVTGVQNMSILYGVTRNAGAPTGSCADTYLNASQMTAADWSKVCSVRVSLSFVNKLDAPAGSTVATAPITLSRVIAIMSMAGVNT